MAEPDARVRTLIVDDEPLARAGLRRLLNEVTWVDVIGEAANGPAALQVIESQRPELVLLDIRMPGLSGLDVWRRLLHRPWVVFTTAFAEHAVDAFELGALDYLLKPFGPERLQAALDRIRAAAGEPAPAPWERLAETLGQGPLQRLFVRSGRAIQPLSVQQVIRFEAMGDYVLAHTAGAGIAAHVLHLALSRLALRLDAQRFVRIHRAHIVNLDHVAAFRRDGTQMQAEMRDGATLPVSRGVARQLRGVAR
ncbi:MAG: LytR/AlgR family response regulator transcription factor [Aquabacterium sp.]